MPKPRFLLILTVASSLAVGSLGCVGYSSTDNHTNREPEVNTGAGAVILWPGQAPAMPPPPSLPPPGSSSSQGYGPAPPPSGAPSQGGPTTGRAAPSSAPSVGQGGFTYIGGSKVHEKKDVQSKSGAIGAPQIPILNILFYPFGAIGALIGKPFLKHAVHIEQKPGQSSQSQTASTTPAPKAGAASDPQAAYERSRRKALERELASRGLAKGAGGDEANSSAPSQPSPGRATGPPPSGGAQQLSIADELAELRGQAPRPAPGPGAPEAHPSSSGPSTAVPSAAPPAAGSRARPSPPRQDSLLQGGVADQVKDDNGDGRPDHWVYRQDGRVVREVFDSNGDGKPDRVILYDPKTGAKVASEEDTNLDGRIDTWIEYRNGMIARQRRDTNHDGFPDTWSYYNAKGVLTRQEQDRNGDGFRDRILLYKNGKLVKEEEDRNGDGKIDRVTYYDSHQRIVRCDEDRDGDGLIDTRSYYKDGKLARREFLSEAVLSKPIMKEPLSEPAWDEGSAPSQVPPKQSPPTQRP